jgi:hypothetical protein
MGTLRSLGIRSEHVRFGLLCMLAYAVLSWAVRFDMPLGGQIVSLVYPLDTFSMYSTPPDQDTSMLLVRDAAGTVHRVMAFRTFDCAQPVRGATAQCVRTRGIPYHYDDLARYVEAHAGPGEQEVDLVTRTWRVRAGAPIEQEADCVVAHCRVSR